MDANISIQRAAQRLGFLHDTIQPSNSVGPLVHSQGRRAGKEVWR
jgi:hypothetical protein